MKRLTLAGIGCGGRTLTYLTLASKRPDLYHIVGAADPRPERLEKARRIADHADFVGFPSDTEFFARGRLADVLIIGTQDAYHYEPCRKALELGYDVLLEKPIATNLRQVLALDELARRLGRRVVVCHVLRYTGLYQTVKEVLQSGALGRLISIEASEGVGTFHQAHSFVRGHWSVTAQSNPMIVAKSCHDMDILHWLSESPCIRISSFGGIAFFNERNAPAGAPARCTDGCPLGLDCQYNALHYLGREKSWLPYVCDGAETATADEKRAWLAQSPWGRCVYRCDNTAVDHQVLSCQFANGITANFTMTAFRGGRDLVLAGTEGVLYAGDETKRATGQDLILRDHANGLVRQWKLGWRPNDDYGHGGGDAGLMKALHREMTVPSPGDMLTSLSQSVESHAMGFAAEESRLTGQTIEMRAFRQLHQSREGDLA